MGYCRYSLIFGEEEEEFIPLEEWNKKFEEWRKKRDEQMAL
jgi:hypothetical protein